MGTILLIEDDESVNRGIAFTLEKEGYQVYACKTLREAEALFAEHEPDMLICDINLPDGNGLDFMKRVRESGDTYMLCLTANDTESDFVMGYGAGADDYVAKPFSLAVLSMKIQAYFQRKEKAGKSGKELRSGNLRMNIEEMRVFREGKEIFLTRNEWKLLYFLMQHPGQILSKNQILEQLFDVDGEFVDENTVAVNIRRLREKVEPDTAKPEYIKNIRGLGYIWGKEIVRK